MLDSTYSRLIDLLQSADARFRILDHRPEGETRAASRLREHPLEQAAKCLVVRVAMTRRKGGYVLAVVPGDRLVDLPRLAATTGGLKAAMAERHIAEALTGSVSGSIPPVSFRDDLRLVVDPALLAHDELYFNAARLDRSIALRAEDYVRCARPDVVAAISTAPVACS